MKKKMTSNRVNDMRLEREFSLFLDKYFYDRLGVDYERKTDIDSQFRGIDLELKKDKKIVNVDEKAALSYINKKLNTFSFEINFINSAGSLNQGWLFNTFLKTDMYLLCYPTANIEDTAHIKADNFTNTMCYMIKKKSILNYLSNNKDYIFQTAEWLRNSGHDGKYSVPNLGFDFFISRKLKETPVNVLIKRDILEDLSIGVYNISTTRLEKIR